MTDTEELELIKSKIKEIDQQVSAADKRRERFKQAVEKRIQSSEKILEEKIAVPLEELNSLIGKGDFSLEALNLLKDVIGKNRPHLSDLLVELLQPQKYAKPGEAAKAAVNKKARTKIRL